MKRSIRFLIFFVFVFTGFGRLQAETIDRVVAVVNDEPITLYQVDQIMAANLDEIKKAQGAERKGKFLNYRELALHKLIGDKLLDQQMTHLKLQVTEDDVQRAVGNIMQRNGLSREQLAEQVKKKGMAWDEYMADMKVQLKRVKFMGQVIAPRVKVTDADLDEFFAANSGKFANYQSVELAQVIIPLEPTAGSGELGAAQAKAEEVMRKAKKGDNFQDLGKKYSVNPQTAQPAVYQVNQLSPALVEVLSDLKPGEVGDPVRSEMGLHVIKLISRKTLAGAEYQTVREQLRERVFEQKLQEELDKYINELKGKSFIQVKSFS